MVNWLEIVEKKKKFKIFLAKSACFVVKLRVSEKDSVRLKGKGRLKKFLL